MIKLPSWCKRAFEGGEVKFDPIKFKFAIAYYNELMRSPVWQAPPKVRGNRLVCCNWFRGSGKTTFAKELLIENTQAVVFSKNDYLRRWDVRPYVIIDDWCSMSKTAFEDIVNNENVMHLILLDTAFKGIKKKIKDSRLAHLNHLLFEVDGNGEEHFIQMQALA